jgi:uncharacterized protein
MKPISIDKRTIRRFVLGRQGLWPGRRWEGLRGTAQAVCAVEAVQLDPLNMVARSQEIALYGRVVGFRPEHLAQATYQDRQLFDYGDPLYVYPMHELPYWSVHMQRRGRTPRWAAFQAENPGLLEEVKAEIQARGPLGNRDFEGRKRVHSYRGRKDSALALFALWLSGELMIHHRVRFERVYDLRERVVPPEFNSCASEAEAAAFFARKAIAFHGLVRAHPWGNSLSDYLQHKLSPEQAQARMDELVEAGTAAPLALEGSKDIWYALQSDLPLLETLSAGEIPCQWQPLDTTTLEEAVLLAPLDIVSARRRAMSVFDFDYVWEVYKPAHTRRWGYYTLPILYGDRLVARIDSRLERKSMTLEVTGYWPELGVEGDRDFPAALANGLERFAQMIGAQQTAFNGFIR